MNKVSSSVIGLIFEKFNKGIPVKRILETENIIAFWHPKPNYEKHILIVPKKAIKNLVSLNDSDFEYVKDVFVVAKQIIFELGLEKNDFRIITNGGKNQKIGQLHFHLISGKEI